MSKKEHVKKYKEQTSADTSAISKYIEDNNWRKLNKLSNIDENALCFALIKTKNYDQATTALKKCPGLLVDYDLLNSLLLNIFSWESDSYPAYLIRAIFDKTNFTIKHSTFIDALIVEIDPKYPKLKQTMLKANYDLYIDESMRINALFSPASQKIRAEIFNNPNTTPKTKAGIAAGMVNRGYIKWAEKLVKSVTTPISLTDKNKIDFLSAISTNISDCPAIYSLIKTTPQLIGKIIISIITDSDRINSLAIQNIINTYRPFTAQQIETIYSALLSDPRIRLGNHQLKPFSILADTGLKPPAKQKFYENFTNKFPRDGNDWYKIYHNSSTIASLMV